MEKSVLIPKNYTQLEMYLNYNKIDISKIILNTYYDIINLINDWTYLSYHLDVTNENFIYFIKNPRKLVSKIVAVKLYTRKYNINRTELIKIIKNIVNSFDFQNPSIIIYSNKIISSFYLKFTINNFNQLIKIRSQ